MSSRGCQAQRCCLAAAGSDPACRLWLGTLGATSAGRGRPGRPGRAGRAGTAGVAQVDFFKDASYETLSFETIF